MDSIKPGVVIDNGSYCCKAGFACDNHPVSIFRTVVGRPKDRIGFYGQSHYDVFIGDDAVDILPDYELHSPVVRGKIVHWDNMERVWHHIFYRELKVAPEERPVVLALAPTSPIKEKVKCCEIFFETLNAPALFIQSQSVCALYGAGFTTGLTIDLGYDSTVVNPVYEGGLIEYAQMDTNFSGHDLSRFLKNSLLERGLQLGSYSHKIVDDIKRNAMDIPPPGHNTCKKRKYVLPSGEEIDISKEIFFSTELIFHPQSVLGNNCKVLGLHDAVITATEKCDSDLQEDLYSAIVPTGGMSAIPGFTARLKFELESTLGKPVWVAESPEIYCVPWLGAAAFAGIGDIDKVWVKKKQFEEYGEKIVRRKFI